MNSITALARGNELHYLGTLPTRYWTFHYNTVHNTEERTIGPLKPAVYLQAAGARAAFPRNGQY